jgi:hypothetical protein
MNTNRSAMLVVVFLLASSFAATAQSVPPGNVWSRGTTIELFAGGASASGSAGSVTGGAAGWELRPWLGVDGSLAWPTTFGDAETFTGRSQRTRSFSDDPLSVAVRPGRLWPLSDIIQFLID